MILIVLIFLLFGWLFAGVVCFWVARMLGLRSGRSQVVVAGIVFGGPVILVAILVVVGWWLSPTKVSQGDAIGKYEIYQSFFAGEEADWQHETYRMEITEDELILWDARTETVWRYPIEWGWGGKWSFAESEVRHHLVREGPTLYRRQFKHHYVFESPLYGNVFFHRKPWFTNWMEWGAGGGFLVLVLWACARKRGWET